MMAQGLWENGLRFIYIFFNLGPVVFGILWLTEQAGLTVEKLFVD